MKNTRLAHLILQFLRHDSFGIDVVQMGEIDQRLTHVLVQIDRVRVFHELADNFAVLVLDDEHFFGFGHATDDDVAQPTEHRLVKDSARRRAAGIARFVHENGRRRDAERRFAVQIGRQRVPVFQADLEDFRLVHFGYEQQVLQGFQHVGFLAALHQRPVLAQHRAQKHGQVLNKVLFGVVTFQFNHIG